VAHDQIGNRLAAEIAALPRADSGPLRDVTEQLAAEQADLAGKQSSLDALQSTVQALQERAREAFPDVPFRLIVDCGDASGYALACLRAGVKLIPMDPPDDKVADIARQMGAELVRRPT